jgi:hypothetical protein
MKTPGFRPSPREAQQIVYFRNCMKKNHIIQKPQVSGQIAPESDKVDIR